MGLCASANADRTDSKYLAGKGNESKDNGVKRKASEGSISNVTETKIETALAAAKARRLVISDVGFEVDSSFVCPTFDKTSAQSKFISDSLEMNFFMYKELEKDNQKGLVGAMQPYTIKKDDFLMEQGHDGDQMYVVESGTFDIIVNDNVVKSSGAKDVIGELALIYQAPRAASVRCTSTTAIVWGLDRKVFRNLIAGVAASKVDDVQKLLATYPLFSELTDSERAALIDVTVTSMHGPQEKIVQQGDKGEIFYIIKSGSVLCTDEEGDGGSLTVSAGSHGYFGELALINNAPRARTVTTREATELLAITRADFQDLLGSKTDLLQKEACKRVLKTCKLLPGNLSASHVEKICESFELREFTKGQDICKKGDEGHSLFVVGKGEVDVIVNGAVEKTFKIGDFFGEGCLIGKDNKRNATLTVTSDNVMLWELGRDPYKKILEPVNRSIAKTAAIRKEMTELRTVLYGDLKFRRNLGQGTFGLVKLMAYKTKTTAKKHVFALKCMQKKQIVDYKLAGNVLYEKQMMEESDHPFVLKLFKTYQNENELMMLLEIVPGGELFTYLQGLPGNHVTTKHARFIALCVVAVFDYIHDKGICYRDLKPENLMIDGDGYIKMVDFGFAKIVKNKTFTLCGTPEYMAPEIILRKGHAKGVDYWATGILIWECETGETPFADYENYDNRVICENILRTPIRPPQGVSKDVVNILIGDRTKTNSTGLINRRVAKRLGCLARGARDIIEQPYFAELDYQKLLCREIEAPYKPKVGESGIDQANFDPIDDGPPIETYTGDKNIFAAFSTNEGE